MDKEMIMKMVLKTQFAKLCLMYLLKNNLTQTVTNAGGEYVFDNISCW